MNIQRFRLDNYIKIRYVLYKSNQISKSQKKDIQYIITKKLYTNVKYKV